MDKKVELGSLLHETSELLQEAGEPRWAEYLARFIEKLQTAEQDQIREIARQALTMFSGPGSLSDLVVYINGKPSVEINDKLELLRTRVHRTLIDIITGKVECADDRLI